MTVSVSCMNKIVLTPAETDRMREWMGQEGIRWFRHLKGLKGTVIPVLKLNYARKGMPVWPVHYHEGMQVRNWLRENVKAIQDMGPVELDEAYEDIIEDVIK